MNTINTTLINKLEIKKSIFISKLIRINNIKDVDIEIDGIKKEYKDATHYCYAYILDDKKKSSDDNEPGGTAGIQIMDSLLKNDLNYVLCVVIRYFGGIKLGTGNLSRAYKKVVNESINKKELIKLIDGYIININVNYDNQKRIDYLLRHCKYNKEYNNDILYTIECEKELLEILDKNNIIYTIIEEKKIEIN